MNSNYKFVIGGAAGFLACATVLYASGCNGGGAAAGGGGGNSGVVAVVNGSQINEQEFNRYMMMKPVIRVNTGQGPATLPVVGSVGFQALDDLVKRKILTQIAKDENLYPTEKDVEEELAFREKVNPNFVKQLTSRGLTIAMIKEELAVELSKQNLLTKDIKVEADEVEKYIKENPKEFQQPATAEVYFIYAKSEEVQKNADDELKAGQSFQVVAGRHSEETSTARQKGRYPIQAIDSMPQAIRDIVMNTQELRTTNWIQFNEGKAKFYIASKTAARPIEITDTIRETVRRKLAQRRGQAGTDLDERIMRKLAESEVEVNFATLEEPWERYFTTVQDATGAKARETSAEETPAAEEKTGE